MFVIYDRESCSESEQQWNCRNGLEQQRSWFYSKDEFQTFLNKDLTIMPLDSRVMGR